MRSGNLLLPALNLRALQALSGIFNGGRDLGYHSHSSRLPAAAARRVPSGGAGASLLAKHIADVDGMAAWDRARFVGHPKKVEQAGGISLTEK